MPILAVLFPHGVVAVACQTDIQGKEWAERTLGVEPYTTKVPLPAALLASIERIQHLHPVKVLS